MYSNADRTSAALPSRTRFATGFTPSRKRARTGARQSVHTAKSTSSNSIYVVRASRRARLRHALKARGNGERTRWMSARAARAGKLVTSVCRVRRLLYSVGDEDLLEDVGRGMWTVTERGPKPRLGVMSCFSKELLRLVYARHTLVPRGEFSQHLEPIWGH